MKTLNFNLLALVLAFSGCGLSGPQDTSDGVYVCHEVWEGAHKRVFTHDKPTIQLRDDGKAILRLYNYGNSSLTDLEGQWRRDSDLIIVHVKKSKGENIDFELRFRKTSKSVIIDDGSDGPDSPVKYIKEDTVVP